MKRVHFILYVQDQDLSTRFYAATLGQEPVLKAPGMTEFALPGDAVLGLMPCAGIKRLLGEAIEDPMRAAGVPRAELYLLTDQPSAVFDRAVQAGGRILSPVTLRDWGDYVGYVADPDGHVLAFAQRETQL